MDTLNFERHIAEPDAPAPPPKLAHDGSVAAPSRREATSPIPGWLALAIGALWIAMLTTIEILAPAATADPDNLAVVVGLIFEVVLLATILGLASRRRWGLMTSMAGGVVLLGASALCSLGGHAAAWLTAQYIAGAVIFGSSRAALRRF